MTTEGKTFTYSVEDFTTSTTTEVYIRRFNDSERFMKYCMECGNYGKLWVCPPFSHDTLAEIRQYSDVLLVATKIMPDCKEIPYSEAQRLLRPERLRLEKRLRAMEKEYGGRAFAFAGSCLYCPDDTCARIKDKPCRHPDLVRPSLEAYGFDLGKTATELFGFPLLWGKDGYLPEYLTLICALFHNSPSTPQL